VPQALLLSALLCYWVNNPGKKWLTWLLTVPFFLLLAFMVFAVYATASGMGAPK
jgi:hypothetical protein